MHIKKEHAIGVMQALNFKNPEIWPVEVLADRMNRLGEVLHDKEDPFNWGLIDDPLVKKKLHKAEKAILAKEAIIVFEGNEPPVEVPETPETPDIPEPDEDDAPDADEEEDDADEEEEEEDDAPDVDEEEEETSTDSNATADDDADEEETEEEDSNSPEVPASVQIVAMHAELMEAIQSVLVLVTKIRKTQKKGGHVSLSVKPAKVAPKAPAAKPAPEKPKAKPALKAEKTPVDKFGSRIGTGRAAVNAVLTRKAQTTKEIVKLSKQSDATVAMQLKELRAKGFLAKNEKGYFLKKK